MIPFGFHSQRAEALTSFPIFTLFLLTDPLVVTFGLAVVTAGLAVETAGFETLGTHF
jgi:hypothetical protein